MIIKTLLVIIFSLNIASSVSAQLLPKDSLKIEINSYNLTHPDINYTSLAFIGVTSIASGILIHNYQFNSWWQDNSNKFKFVNSFKQNNWINEAGKFYSTNLIAHFYSASLEGAGIEYEKATIYSAAIALGYGFYVETFDGFSSRDGFNITELMFNFIGAGYVLGQYYFPDLKNFQPRFSYYPSKKFLNEKLANRNILGDFEGQKYWIGIRIKEYLPKDLKNYWPSFLMVSLGMGVNKYTNNNYDKNEFYIAFDIDAEEIPLYGNFWQFLKNTLNYLHFPMPGIRITPNSTAFLFCY